LRNKQSTHCSIKSDKSFADSKNYDREVQDCEEKPVVVQYEDDFEFDSLGTGNAQMLSTEHSENDGKGSFNCVTQNDLETRNSKVYSSTGVLQEHGSGRHNMVDEYKD